jgi:lipid II:glycine glycyltransferase (peptidoglycan interpeptide bridge formation enzyme)
VRDTNYEVAYGPAGAYTSVLSEEFPDGFDEFVERTSRVAHTQTTAWALVQQARGWRPYAFSLFRHDRPVAVAMVVVRDVGRLGRIAYIAGGPIVGDSGLEPREATASALTQMARSIGARLLVVGPPPADAELVDALRRQRFGPTQFTVTLPATVKVDLSPDEDTLLANMKSKTRYNIRKGLRGGLTVRVGGSEDVGVFRNLVASTADRQGFSPPPVAHLAAMHDVMAARGHARLFLAEADGTAVAGILTIAWGDSVVYKRGGWSGDRPDLRPNEVLHWEAMRWAKQAGFHYYDFDGIDGDVAEIVLRGEPIPDDELQSVTRFKLGFGGVPEMRPPVLSFVSNPVLRFGYQKVFPRVRHWPMFERLRVT